MKQHLTRAVFSCLALGLTLFWACRKPIELDDSDKNFPLELNVDIQGDSAVITWEDKRVTGFERAVVVRSEKPIPAGLNPFAPGNANVFRVIFDSNSPSKRRVVEVLPTFQSKGYYKLYMKLSGRDEFIESDEVARSFSSFVADGRPEMIRVHPDSSWIAYIRILNGSMPQITVVDKATYQELGRIAIADLTDPNLNNLVFSTVNGQANLIVTTGVGRYLRFSMPELELLEESSLGSYTWGILPSPNGNLLFATQQDPTYGFTIRKTAAPATIFKYFDRPNSYYYVRELAFLDPATLALIEIGPYQMTRLKFNATTGVPVASYTRSVTLQGQNPIQGDVSMTADRQLFIPNLSGSIFDAELTNRGTVPPSQQGSLTDIRISKDGAFIYVLEQDFTVFKTRIRKLKYPEMTEVSKKEFMDTQGIRLEPVTDGSIMLIGSNGIEPQRHTIKQVNL